MEIVVTDRRIWVLVQLGCPQVSACRVTPKSQSGSLYAAETKWWFTDTQCNVRFISVEAIIVRIV